jgi:hypothetical protein
MKRLFTFLACLLGFTLLNAQSPGDTIRVQAFDFNSDSRDTVIQFPAEQNLSYEKILLKYGMRCHDALVSTVSNRNLGCREWDFSCNTYIVDSTKIETLPAFTNSHFITNFTGTSFEFLNTPVYNFMRGTQTDVEISATNAETLAKVGSGTEALDRVLSTDHVAGKSQYLYTAEELSAAGFVAGPIHGMSIGVLGDGGEAQFLKILMKNSTKQVLDAVENGFSEVYYKNTILKANEENRFQFATPFTWDGSSNLVVEFNFTNLNPVSATVVEGERKEGNFGLTAVSEQEIMITNNTYIECVDYTGVLGSQNRTMEAWVKTTNGASGEILAWGNNTNADKWVWRFVNGRLRLEINGGGTESSTEVNDGVWHHVACVLDGNNLSDIKFYVDGVLDANATVGNLGITTASASNVRISRGINNRYLDSFIDDVRIWDTALSEETIDTWKNIKVDESHPNYDNLQLNFRFDGEGQLVEDSSIHGRDATIIGERYTTSEISGSNLFKEFSTSSSRPNITFYQGDYETNVTNTLVDRPVAKEPAHLVVTQTVIAGDPNVAVDDAIVVSEPVQYWTPDISIFDENTGELLSEEVIASDGVFTITELEYQRRFPFYNELVSFVTPYGIGLDLGETGISFEIDMSDYVSILTGDKRLLMTLGGQNQEEMDLEFLFIVGTPPRDVVQYEQLWQGTNRFGNVRINDILNDVRFAPTSLELSSEASSFKLKSTITGHGSEGEFAQNGGQVTHKMRSGESDLFEWTVTQECSMNPIFPQGGTWVFDRQGWCPGEQSFTHEADITGIVPAGDILNIDYTTTAPPVAGGDYRYHVAHQVVGYGEPNFQNDASVQTIMAPNNGAEFRRVGNICGNPIVVIRNTGANRLTRLTINYWINESLTPQTYEWEGSLDFMEEERIEIPAPRTLWFDLLNDNNRFYVEIENPNGMADEYPFNNTKNATFDLPASIDNDIFVSFRTNNNASENSYQLLDGEGNVVGSNSLLANNTTYTDPYSLADGCYKLVVTDSGQDGVEWFASPAQGSGVIRLQNTNGLTLRTFEPDFGGGFEFSFNTNFSVSNEEIEFLTSIELYPNPTSQLATIVANDILDVEVFMLDVLGREVATYIQSQMDKSVTLDVRHLDAGVYFVVLQRDDLRTTRKLIVE